MGKLRGAQKLLLPTLNAGGSSAKKKLVSVLNADKRRAYQAISSLVSKNDKGPPGNVRSVPLLRSKVRNASNALTPLQQNSAKKSQSLLPPPLKNRTKISENSLVKRVFKNRHKPQVPLAREGKPLTRLPRDGREASQERVVLQPRNMKLESKKFVLKPRKNMTKTWQKRSKAQQKDKTKPSINVTEKKPSSLRKALAPMVKDNIKSSQKPVRSERIGHKPGGGMLVRENGTDSSLKRLASLLSIARKGSRGKLALVVRDNKIASEPLRSRQRRMILKPGITSGKSLHKSMRLKQDDKEYGSKSQTVVKQQPAKPSLNVKLSKVALGSTLLQRKTRESVSRNKTTSKPPTSSPLEDGDDDKTTSRVLKPLLQTSADPRNKITITANGVSSGALKRMTTRAVTGDRSSAPSIAAPRPRAARVNSSDRSGLLRRPGGVIKMKISTDKSLSGAKINSAVSDCVAFSVEGGARGGNQSASLWAVVLCVKAASCGI